MSLAPAESHAAEPQEVSVDERFVDAVQIPVPELSLVGVKLRGDYEIEHCISEEFQSLV